MQRGSELGVFLWNPAKLMLFRKNKKSNNSGYLDLSLENAVQRATTGSTSKEEKKQEKTFRKKVNEWVAQQLRELGGATKSFLEAQERASETTETLSMYEQDYLGLDAGE